MILSIETGHAICSVCLDDGQTFLYREAEHTFAHGRMLTVFIQQLMEEAGISFNQLDAVAYSAGPGSYTGLRIGLSVAKGICWAAEKPLIAVSSMQAMALYAQQKTENLTADWTVWINARHGRVYAAVYDATLHTVSHPTVITLNKPHSIDGLFLTMDDPEALRLLCTGVPAAYLPNNHTAKEIAQIARYLYIKKYYVDLKTNEPEYVTGFGLNFLTK